MPTVEISMVSLELKISPEYVLHYFTIRLDFEVIRC